MSIRKASLQEFQHQIKDVRSQLVNQIKSLEQRTDVQVSILHEINDFLKKRAEIDLEYSKQLDKLVKSVMLKHKNEKQKRSTWSLHSTCSLWQQLVDDTKEEAKQRGITSEVYGNHITNSMSARCNALQKLSKKCREVGVLAQGEVMRVIDELFAALKTYQLCYSEYSIMNVKLQQAEAEKSKTQDLNSVRKQKSLQKNFDKKSAKFNASRLKCDRARNEYLLSIEAANASLHKFFADDLSDLIDCTDLGMEYWLNLIITNIISARKAACQTEMNSLANLSTFKESLQPQLDKRKFFECNNSVFMLPKRFEFKCDASEQINTIGLSEGMSADLKQRHYQMRKRLEKLRMESEESLQTLEQTEQSVHDLLAASTLVEITEHGIRDNRPLEDTIEAELAKANEYYVQKFRFYLLNANLIVRLEARADGIGNALVKGNYPLNSSFKENEGDDGIGGASQAQPTSNQPYTDELANVSDLDWHEQVRRKKRLGSQASATTAESVISNANNVVASSGAQFSPLRRRRPRLFGGSLEEYVELTGEKIPLVVTSCIRVLSQFALHHQGVFRVSGSQVEINLMKEAFENGEDPLYDVKNANDVNSIAGVLKLYFRELREPLFPFYLFELLTDCSKYTNTVDFINEMSSLLCKLPRPNYLLLRYLFAFLNHLSEFSDENMMDHYNLAICFGPTLLPIPEGKDQVYYQTSVNEVVKNLIIHHDLIFTARLAGPRYEKYHITDSKAINDVDLYMDDTDEYFGSSTAIGTNASSNTTAGGSADGEDKVNSAEFFDYRNYANEMLKNPLKLLNESDMGTNALHSTTMNASIVSANSLGFSNYSESLPPSITATLLKPANNNNKTQNDTAVMISNRETRSSTKFNSPANDLGTETLNNGGKSVKSETCVMEESELDAFLKTQYHIDVRTPSPRGDYPRNASQSLRQKMRPFQSSPSAGSDISTSSNALSGKESKESSFPNTLSSYSKSKITNATIMTSNKPSTGVTQSTRRPSLRDDSQSCGSQHGNNDVRDGRSRTRDSSRKQDRQQLPPLLPQSQQPHQYTDSAQYSQILTKSERVRMPESFNNTLNTLNRQRSQAGTTQPAYYQQCGTNEAIPPSYNTLYGDSSPSFRTLPPASSNALSNKNATKNNQPIFNTGGIDVISTTGVRSDNVNGSGVVFRNSNRAQKQVERKDAQSDGSGIKSTGEETEQRSSSPTKVTPLNSTTITSPRKAVVNKTRVLNETKADISNSRSQQSNNESGSPKKINSLPNKIATDNST